MEPILKWAGGKRKLIPQIIKYIDVEALKKGSASYFEPFIGGGSLCFYLEPSVCYINDYNYELVNLYKVIKRKPYKLIDVLSDYSKKHSKDFYYEIRDLDKYSCLDDLSDLDRAARLVYLNKTCYNGLYRENSKGHFNVPLGKYVNPDIVMKDRIITLSKYFKNNSVEITYGDFSNSLEKAKAGDYIYFDPPYDYESNGFTQYVSIGFSHEDLIRLKNICDDLIERGCHVIISNNDTAFVNKLFTDKKYQIEHIEAARFISCDGKKRQKAREVIIHG